MVINMKKIKYILIFAVVFGDHIFPTLAEFIRAKIPQNIDLDGRSLKPMIGNPKAKWNDRSFERE